MSKKIIAILLALSFVFAFAACGDKSGDETTTAPVETTADPFAAGDETEKAPADETTAASVDTSAVSEEDSTAASEADTSDVSASEEATTEAANAMPQGKEAIVAYFNTAVNSVKTDAKSVKHHYSKISLNGSTNLPSWADSLLKLFGGADKFIDDQLTSNSKGEQVYTGSDIKNKYPVENESWASKLTASDVQEAKIIEKDGQYVIRITTVADSKSSTVQHGQGHAPKAFNVVLPGVVNDALGKIPGATNLVGGEAEMNYPASTATIYVDIATGRVVKADYDLKWTINFGTEVVLPFKTVDSYTISY